MVQVEMCLLFCFWTIALILIWLITKYGVLEAFFPLSGRASNKALVILLVIIFIVLMALDTKSGENGFMVRLVIIKMNIFLFIYMIIASFFFRWLIFSPGRVEYERAKAHLRYYLERGYYVKAEMLYKGTELNTSLKAKKALTLYDQAIKKAEAEKKTPKILMNLAIAYCEKGQMFRIMNSMRIAEECYLRALEILNDPIFVMVQNAKDSRYWGLKSLFSSRLGELNHCQGLTLSAQIYYEQSLAIDKEHRGNKEDINETLEMLTKLGDYLPKIM